MIKMESRPARLDKGHGFRIQKKTRDQASPAHSHAARDLCQIVLHFLRTHVGKHRGQKDEIEGRVSKRKLILAGFLRSIPVEGFVENIGVDELKVRKTSILFLAPSDSMANDFDAHIF